MRLAGIERLREAVEGYRLGGRMSKSNSGLYEQRDCLQNTARNSQDCDTEGMMASPSNRLANESRVTEDQG